MNKNWWNEHLESPTVILSTDRDVLLTDSAKAVDR